MSFEYRPTETKITLYSDAQPNLTFPLVAADQTLQSITIPSDLQGNIKHAFLHITAGWIYSDAAGADLDGVQYAQISVSGGALHNAIKFLDNGIYVPSAVNWTAPFDFYGSIDIAAHINKGDTVDIQITNAHAASGFLRLYNVTAILDLYMGD